MYNSIMYRIVSYCIIWTLFWSSQYAYSQTKIQKNEPVSPIFTQALELYKSRQFEPCTQLLWKNIDKIPRNGFILLARAHEAKKEFSDMIKALQFLVTKNDKDYEALTLMGIAYKKTDKQREALEQLKNATEANPQYEPPYKELADIYTQRKNYYELRLIYQDMIKLIGPKAEYYNQLCKINYIDGIYDPAIADCSIAISKNKQYPDNYVYQALSYKNKGELDKGAQLLKQTADKFAASEFAQYSYAAYLAENKDFIQSYKYFKIGTNSDPQSVRSWIGLGQSAFELKKYDESLKSFSQACSLDKQTVTHLRKIAGTLRLSKSSWSRQFEQLIEKCGL